jgi:hypothetical protein
VRGRWGINPDRPFTPRRDPASGSGEGPP